LQNLYGLTQTGAGAAGSLGSQAIQGSTAVGNANVGAGNANASGIAGAAGAVANAAGKLPWQQIGNYFSGSGSYTPDPNISNGSLADSAVFNDPNMTVQPIDLYGDNSNP
jgi:hypothetical protein